LNSKHLRQFWKRGPPENPPRPQLQPHRESRTVLLRVRPSSCPPVPLCPLTRHRRGLAIQGDSLFGAPQHAVSTELAPRAGVRDAVIPVRCRTPDSRLPQTNTPRRRSLSWPDRTCRVRSIQ